MKTYKNTQTFLNDASNNQQKYDRQITVSKIDFDVQEYTENVLQPITEECLKKIDHFGNCVGTE